MLIRTGFQMVRRTVNVLYGSSSFVEGGGGECRRVSEPGTT